MARSAFSIEHVRLAEARHLPGPCHDEFLRLTRTLIHGPAFQWLLIDAPDEGLRKQVMTGLDKVLQRAGLTSNRLPLSKQILDVPMLEARLVKNARQAAVVHVIGRRDWFDAARWEAFNIRRERLAAEARARLVFWLDGEAIALASRSAPDLWAWRGGVYAFLPSSVPASNQHFGLDIPVPGARLTDSAEADGRTMAEQSRRVAEIREWLAQHPEAPDELKIAPLDELGKLLFRLGDVDDALVHCREVEIPFYRRLGDSRGEAITMGQIADILHQQGETDQALRIYREEILPVFQRLGDRREGAITLSEIADILKQKGETDEALRIYKEELLPVFERLGDVRSRAVTIGKIADILQQQGEMSEALRIRREEELPVYERLGDVQSRAITMGKIADILQQRGEMNEALRIYRDELLPIFERLGDQRAKATTMERIACILQARQLAPQATAKGHSS
jgi:tetratricopeptide (TPR) repeat protein